MLEVSLYHLIMNGNKNSNRQIKVLVVTENEYLVLQSYTFLKVSILKATNSISLVIMYFNKDFAL